MPPDISGNLFRISKAAAEINAMADQATEQIRALDEFLAVFSPGVEVYQQPEGAGFAQGRGQNKRGHHTEIWYRLGYARDDEGKFGLVIQARAWMTDATGDNVTDLEGNWQDEVVWVRRLLKVNRELRIAAMESLSDFVSRLAEESEKAANSLRESLAKTAAVVDELRVALGKPPAPAEQGDAATGVKSKGIAAVNAKAAAAVAASQMKQTK